jgi:hypothetical protein
MEVFINQADVWHISVSGKQDPVSLFVRIQYFKEDRIIRGRISGVSLVKNYFYCIDKEAERGEALYQELP